MSTRATVWIKNENTGEERFLYHHCDGYALDDELADVLLNIPAQQWGVDTIADAIIANDDAYGRHKVDDIGWDSEYVYVISIRSKTLTKYECGCWFQGEHKEDGMSIQEEKTQPKYIVRQLEIGPCGGIATEELRFDGVQEKKRTVERIKDFAFQMKNLIDWAAGASGLDDEAKKSVVSILYGMYHGDSSV